MNKIASVLSIAAIFCGCSHMTEIDQPFQDVTQTEGEFIDQLPEILYASLAEENSDSDTRTYVQDDKYILWQNGDEISYFAEGFHNVKYRFNGSDGAASAEFTKVSDTGSTGSKVKYTHAVYPYYKDATYTKSDDIETITVFYPSVQHYAPDSFGKGANVMYAVGTTENGADTDLKFRNLCGYLVIKLYGSGNPVRTINIKAHLDRLSLNGHATVETTNAGEPVVTMGGTEHQVGVNTVTLYCGEEGVRLGADAANATEFWFALPPVTFENGLEIEVTDVTGVQYVKMTSNPVTIRRNQIQPMAALCCTPVTPPDNQLWYNTYTNEMITEVDDDYGDGAEKFYVGETEYFDATITAHYYDQSLGRFVIEFDKELTTIKESAFHQNPVSQVYFPQTLTTIEDAFGGSTLTSITIPGNVTHIKSGAFRGCARLESITIEPGSQPLNFEEESPFYDSDLTFIKIDRNITQIKNNEDLENNISLDHGGLFHQHFSKIKATVVIGDNVTRINNGMFQNLDIWDIAIPSSVTSIGEAAFAKCDQLSGISIPSSVTSIGHNAFYYCNSLSTVDIQKSEHPLSIGYQVKNFVTDYEYGSFYDSPLKSITLKRELVYKDQNGNDFTPDSWEEGIFANKHYGNDGLTTTVSVGNMVMTISDYMFSGVRLTALWIPTSVSSIGDYAFYDCRVLGGITLGHHTPPTLGEGAFDSCDVMWYISVPKGTADTYKDTDNWSDWVNYNDKDIYHEYE